jgi:hypothetical protein
MTHRAFYSLAEHEKNRSNLVGTISRAGVSHGGIPTRMASERERENESPGFEANMWESGREVVFRFKWDGVTEPNAKAVG